MHYWILACFGSNNSFKIEGKTFQYHHNSGLRTHSDSNEEEIEKFYENLDIAKKQSGSQDVRIIMGDLNAKVGKQQNDDEGIVGGFGLGERNDRGEKWINWCKSNKQIMMNTWFKQHPRRLWTWQHPNGYRNQIDYITINSRFRGSIRSAKSYPGADCGSDHNPVISTLQVRLKKIRKHKPTPKLFLEGLKETDTNIKYSATVENKYNFLTSEGHSKWKAFQSAVTTSANEVLPTVRKKAKQPWITETILEQMDERRMAKQQTEYHEISTTGQRNKK